MGIKSCKKTKRYSFKKIKQGFTDSKRFKKVNREWNRNEVTSILMEK